MQLQRRVELADGIDHMPGALLDFQDRLPRFIGQRHAKAGAAQARLHAGDRAQRQVMVAAHYLDNFQGGGTGARCQAADLIGHHGKTATMLARPRGLNCSIECQQVSLVGNPADGLHDLADAVRLFAHRVNALRRFIQVLGNSFDDLHGLLHHLRTFLRTGIVLH